MEIILYMCLLVLVASDGDNNVQWLTSLALSWRLHADQHGRLCQFNLPIDDTHWAKRAWRLVNEHTTMMCDLSSTIVLASLRKHEHDGISTNL